MMSQFCTDSGNNQEKQVLIGNLSPIEEAVLCTPQKHRKPLCMDFSSATKSRPSILPVVCHEPYVVDLLSTPRPLGQACYPEIAAEKIGESLEPLSVSFMHQNSKYAVGLSAICDTSHTDRDDGGGVSGETSSQEVEVCTGLSTPMRRVSVVDLISPCTSTGNKTP